jgi:hypothetical protein
MSTSSRVARCRDAHRVAPKRCVNRKRHYLLVEQLMPEFFADEFDNIQVVPQTRPAGGVSIYQLPTHPETCMPVVPRKHYQKYRAEGNCVMNESFFFGSA